MADGFWYQMGRWHGAKVWRLLCRISLTPNSCIPYIQTALRRHGASALLFAKFVPGLNFAAPPLAGTSGVSPLHFLLFDGLASVLWAGGYMMLGYTFSGQFERLEAYTAGLPTIGVMVLIAAPAAFIGVRLMRSQRPLFSLGAGMRSRAVQFKAGAQSGKQKHYPQNAHGCSSTFSRLRADRWFWRNAVISERFGENGELEKRHEEVGKRTLKLSAVAFSLSVAALVAFAQTQAVSGRWTTTLERGQQSMTVKMDLKVSGNSVTGTIDLAPDVTVQIQNGKLEGDQLTFDVTAPEHGHTKSIRFTGDVRDDTITLKNESRGKQGRTMTFHWIED
jgi:hypothetical protein